MTTNQTEPAPQTTRPNPFRRAYHQRLKGQYLAPQVSDHNQTSIHTEQAAVDFERARAEAIQANRQGTPCNPF